jgi:DNA primase
MTTQQHFEVIFQQYVLNARRSAAELIGRCPFHHDKKPSFSANVETGQWRCHAGCGQGGIKAFLEKLKDAGIEFEQVPAQPDTPASASEINTTPKASPTLPEGLLIDFEEIPQDVKEFLIEKRGIKPKVIDRYELGYDASTSRITIPIRDEQNQLVNVRCYHPKADAKMISYREGYGQARLFPIRMFKKANEGDDKLVALCEGELDALCGISHWLKCVTQTGGANTWKSEFSPGFKDLNVIIAYDNDDAGRAGALKAAQSIASHAASVEIVQWPDFMEEKEDLTDFFVKHRKTKDDFLQLPRKKFDPAEHGPDGQCCISCGRGGNLSQKIDSETEQEGKEH